MITVYIYIVYIHRYIYSYPFRWVEDLTGAIDWPMATSVVEKIGQAAKEAAVREENPGRSWDIWD